jgi:uncharacterized protein
VERGPLVLCAESVDLPTESAVDIVRVDPSVPPQDRGGTVVVTGELIDPPERAWPYAPDADAESDSGPVDIPLIPNHDWANRGPSTMRVWLPTTRQ